MPRGKRIKDRDVVCAAVAMLAGRGLKADSIATRLSIKEPTVRTLIAEAVKAEFLRKYHFDGSQLPDGMVQRARALLGTGEQAEALTALLTRFAGIPVEIHVSLSVAPSDDSDSLRVFGEDASLAIKGFVTDKRVRTAGVAYGAAIHSVLRGLQSICPTAPRADNPVTWLPLRCDAGLVSNNVSPSNLAHAFAKVVNGDGQHRFCPSPLAVPPVLPYRASRGARSRAVLKTYLESLPFYSRCYGPSASALIRKTRLIVCSVGPARPVSAITKWMYDVAEFDVEKSHCLGDVAGIPILDPNRATDEDRSEVERYESENLIGAKRSDFTAVVERRGRSVAVVARDLTRVSCLLEAVRLKMFNTLLIDDVIAEEMLIVLPRLLQ